VNNANKKSKATRIDFRSNAMRALCMASANHALVLIVQRVAVR
jgi:hypothetical protein